MCHIVARSEGDSEVPMKPSERRRRAGYWTFSPALTGLLFFPSIALPIRKRNPCDRNRDCALKTTPTSSCPRRKALFFNIVEFCQATFLRHKLHLLVHIRDI